MGEVLPTHNPQRYSVAEYLALERSSEQKHEYIEGEIIAMAGGRPEHSRITTNTTRALGNALISKKCIEYNSDLQVAVSYYEKVFMRLGL
jgi:Uma2 family endonuclease